VLLIVVGIFEYMCNIFHIYFAMVLRLTGQWLYVFGCLECQTDLTMAQLSAMEVERNTLRSKVRQRTWGVHRIQDNDKATKFYTGLPSFAVFIWLFKYLKFIVTSFID